jgi:hypothetical protein
VRCCLELKRDEAALLFEPSTRVSELADAMSPQRHKLAAPIVVSHGIYETPEFQRQSRDFAVKAAGRPVEFIEGQ